jgi:O-antigen ligase
VTLDHRATPVAPVRELRGSARRQAHTLSGGVLAVVGAAASLLVVGLLFVLDYRFDQEAHRLVKLVLGMTGVGAILLRPRAGLFLLPLAIPFLGWMPRIPVPFLNADNVLVFGAFFAWICGRVLTGQRVFRTGRLGPVIGVFVGVTILGLVRGAAFPLSPSYDTKLASTLLFRATVPFVIYFMGLSMLRGQRDRRWMGGVLALALVAESVTTILCGGNGRGGRAEGSFGQANELGAFLAMFTCLAAAMIPAARSWLARLALAAGAGAGVFAIFMSLSRGAMVAVAVGLMFVALRSSRVMTVLLLLLLVSAPLWLPANVKQRITSTQVDVEGSDEVAFGASTQKRLNTWQIILSVAGEHPIEGVGYAGLGGVIVGQATTMGVETVASSSHNTFLRMLGEMGIFGLFAFLWLIWRCLRLAADGVRLAADRMDRQLAVGLGAATIALAISCLFGDRFFQILIVGNFWMLCAVVQDQVLERRERGG